MSLRYRLVTPTGTLGSFMCYSKRKIYIFSSEVMCRWDGKKSTRKTTDPEFESRPTIFAKNTSLRHRLFYPVLMGVTFGLGFRVPVQKPVPKPLPNRCLWAFSSSASFHPTTQSSVGENGRHWLNSVQHKSKMWMFNLTMSVWSWLLDLLGSYIHLTCSLLSFQLSSDETVVN